MSKAKAMEQAKAEWAASEASYKALCAERPSDDEAEPAAVDALEADVAAAKDQAARFARRLALAKDKLAAAGRRGADGGGEEQPRRKVRRSGAHRSESESCEREPASASVPPPGRQYTVEE